MQYTINLDAYPEISDMIAHLAAQAGLTPEGWVAWHVLTACCGQLCQNAPLALRQLVTAGAADDVIAAHVKREAFYAQRLHDGAPDAWKVPTPAPRPQPDDA